MRIKIIGDNNCARATRHLLRLAGFAVTEFLPADALVGGPLAGYAITIDLAPAPLTPDASLGPDRPTHHQHASASGEAPRLHRDASSPAFVRQTEWRTTAGRLAFGEAKHGFGKDSVGGHAPGEATVGGAAFGENSTGRNAFGESSAGLPAVAPANFRSEGGIHFDSVDSALEAAVLRHVTQLAAAPVVVDRPGGVVHSDRELRIVAPNTGDAKCDEAAAVAIEFGVLRGLLDLTSPASAKATASRGVLGLTSRGNSSFGGATADASGEGPAISRRVGGKKWWPFGILVLAAALGLLRANTAATPGRLVVDTVKGRRLKPALLKAVPLLRAGLAAVTPGFAGTLRFTATEPAQEQIATGSGFRITDGTNFLVVDPCKAQAKLYASISQTANTQLVAGTASRKIYVCSIHVVAAAAANVAVVEGTGSVCGTSTTGVTGFGGATAATGWNFAANGGIALGNGDSSLGAEGTSGDNLCIYNSGSGQVSGGISYVVE